MPMMSPPGNAVFLRLSASGELLWDAVWDEEESGVEGILLHPSGDLIGVGTARTQSFGVYANAWRWAEGAWTEEATGQNPGVSIYAVAYDEARGRGVLFGGSDGPLSAPEDGTWVFEASSGWRRLETAGSSAVAQATVVSKMSQKSRPSQEKCSTPKPAA